MDLNRLVNMVVNQLIRRVIKVVVDRGIGLASRSAGRMGQPKPDQIAEATAADRAKDAQLRGLADKAAKTGRIARRIDRL